MSDSDDQPLFVELDVDKAFDIEFGNHRNLNVYCPFHEDPGASRTQSCSVSRDGLYNCKVCGARGTSVDFYAQVHGITEDEARAALTMSGSTASPKRSRKVTRVGMLDESIVKRCHENLMRSSIFVGYLLAQRGLSMETLKKYKIGCDEYRITIPVYEDGKLANIRRYLPNAINSPKMVTHQNGDGTPRLYPSEVLDTMKKGEEIIICEGEWDCLLLLQNGFKAVTVTSGVTTWDDAFTEKLADYKCVFLYDVNDKEGVGVPPDLGQRVSVQRAKMFLDRKIAAKSVRLPIDMQGGDVTNWFVDLRKSAGELRKLIDNVPFGALSAPPDVAPPEDFPLVTLHDAAKSSYFYKPIRIRCLVAGKGNAPYIVPCKVLCEIVMEDDSSQSFEKDFDIWDGSLLSLVDVTQTGQKRAMKALMGIDPKLQCSMTVLNTVNIEELFLIPAIERNADHGVYTLRRAFYIGHGLQTNRIYEFEGYTLPHPQTQVATHIFVSAKPADSDVDSFRLSKESDHELRKLFHTHKPVGDMFDELAGQLSTHVTEIYGRSDLHVAVDLAYHSALSFKFNNAYVHKGWLEILILGDTRTGKGYVAEGLTRFYGVGEVVNGEMVTIAGLVGGIQQLGDRITLTWGKIPLNDKRCVVIDESGSLSQAEISRLSRVRSEGVAEITKILTEKTTSRTRLIWIANPRIPPKSKPLLLADLYNHGIEAVPDLIGAAEDIARFDFVLITAQNEVSSKTINQHHGAKGKLKYSRELCQELLMWVWSRTTDQVIFDDGVVDFILKASQEMGTRFSAKFALVQAEDIRYKLARIAVAAAGRLFSTDETGQNIIVKKEHAEFAYNYLCEIYAKPACGYAQLSALDREQSTLRNPKAVRKILEQAGDSFNDLIDGLLNLRHITLTDLCDYSSLDRYQATSTISELVRQRAIVKENAWYVKRPAFKTFLQRLKDELAGDGHVTSGDE